MKQKSQLREEQDLLQNQSKQQEQAHEFQSVDELLQFDASQQPPPHGLGLRVKESVESVNAHSKVSFWKKLTGRFGSGRSEK
jgi:hypothetical protein